MSRRFYLAALALLIVPLLASACLPTPTLTPTPQRILADAFFYGRAYVDANGNGQVDPGDPPLKGALFVVIDGRGIPDRRPTGADGRAEVWWPGGTVGQPTLRMEPPTEGGYTPIGPREVVGRFNADFLFAPPVARTPTR